MIKIEDFENAPAGATATHKVSGSRVMKVNDGEQYWITSWGSYLSDGQMGLCDYMLDPSPATAAREALDLAWELAHPVKPGQVIPKGARYVRHSQGGRLATFTATECWTPTPRNTEYIRTLDPLPDPEPDWLDAPAVIAVCNEVMDRAVFVRHGDNWWVSENYSAETRDLRDVTPLYPKGQDQ